MFQLHGIADTALKLNDDQIHPVSSPVHSTKFLGIYIDSKLNWGEHITNLKTKEKPHIHY